jgi:carbon-monoxide dehydrogenase large subunit
VELIAADFTGLPAAAGPAAAVAEGAVQIHDSIPGNICFDYEYGDAAATDAAFARAASIIRLDLTSDRVVGNPMEPKSALAAWDGDKVDIWTGTQGMAALRDSLAAMTGCGPSTSAAASASVAPPMQSTPPWCSPRSARGAR